MSLSRNARLSGAALLAAIVAATAPAAAEPGFVDDLQRYDKKLWRKSDGWANGWEKNDTGWVARHITIAGGRMAIALTDDGASRRRFASGEYQSRRFFGYGRFEARLKAIAAPGIATGFFTYTGPTFDGAPHDEIDFEFHGKSPRQVQEIGRAHV